LPGDRAIQDRIGKELREMYADLLKQALPENLIAPLRASDELQAARQNLGGSVTAMRENAEHRSNTQPASSIPQPLVAKGA
jgi:hypothetical protein